MCRRRCESRAEAGDSLDHAIRRRLRTTGGMGERRPRCDLRRGSVSSPKMLRVFVVALTAWVAAGCGADCAQSADIQVTVVPNGDADTVDITRLHVMLGVEDGP